MCCRAVALGGVASVTDDCRVVAGTKICTRNTGYLWWGIWFQFFVTIAVAIALLKEAKGLFPTFQALLAALVSVQMINANTCLPKGTGDGADNANAAAAGYIICSIFDFVLIIVLGLMAAGMSVSMPSRSSGSGAKEAPATRVSDSGLNKVSPEKPSKAGEV